MKDELIEILDLPAGTSEEAVISAIRDLMSMRDKAKVEDEHEAEIRKIMAASYGALNRAGAEEVLSSRQQMERAKV